MHTVWNWVIVEIIRDKPEVGQEVGRYITRDESQGTCNRRPKQGYQWPHKKDFCVLQKLQKCDGYGVGYF